MCPYGFRLALVRALPNADRRSAAEVATTAGAHEPSRRIRRGDHVRWADKSSTMRGAMRNPGKSPSLLALGAPMQLWKEDLRDQQRVHGVRCPRCPGRLRHYNCPRWTHAKITECIPVSSVEHALLRVGPETYQLVIAVWRSLAGGTGSADHRRGRVLRPRFNQTNQSRSCLVFGFADAHGQMDRAACLEALTMNAPELATTHAEHLTSGSVFVWHWDRSPAALRSWRLARGLLGPNRICSTPRLSHGRHLATSHSFIF